MNLETERRRDELLEMLWRLQERGGGMSLPELRRHDADQQYEGYLAEFKSNGAIRVEGDQISFTAKGLKRATDIVRRHRLAETLLVQIMGKTPSETEEAACEFEHVLAPELVNGICTLLGHPARCPHGLPIPEGACCQESRHAVESAVMPLSRMDVGAEARIASINTRDSVRLSRLLAYGLVPGASVTLTQRQPALVVDVERRQIAFEASVGNEIMVWRRVHGG
ncbi:MAG: metal-dependent transcriptional regulator [Magnetococcales bacterium]|nr:metal-dependent transcriptional regulator [Magnetococcales bacterium]